MGILKQPQQLLLTDVRSISQGRASYTMQFEKSGEAPANIADEVIKKAGVEAGHGFWEFRIENEDLDLQLKLIFSTMGSL